MHDMNLIELRKKIIENDFKNLNDMQFKAVTATYGPLLILAGAGSGKTTVLVNKIAYLIKYGNAYLSDKIFNAENINVDTLDALTKSKEEIDIPFLSVDPVKPWQILAITFTNKAAGELKERIRAKIGIAADDIWAGTFHSVCGKILRREAERINLTSDFTIYDTSDQKKLMKDIMKSFGVDDKFVPLKTVLHEISSAKDKLISPENYGNEYEGDIRIKTIKRLYKEYQKQLLSANAMDFDDMIFYTVKILKENEDVRAYYQNKFKFVLVDEYQDTNYAQYVLVSTLAEKYRNICVVGDDDQSIYRFRGATIKNILNFEEEYKESTVIRLEQNYRSTSNILNAANSVIANNVGRKGKTLWTEKGDGDKITVFTGENAVFEAKFVAETVLDGIAEGNRFSDYAVLYRMNAQSSAIENTFARSGIPYKVIGGNRFFDRVEIKDLIAYLCVINNTSDNLRVQRIVNVPKRGIGQTTLNKAYEIANGLSLSLFEVFRTADSYPSISRAASKLKEFCDLIEEIRDKANSISISELFEIILNKTNYFSYIESEYENSEEKTENIKELASNIVQYELDNDEPTLSGFLENVALVNDTDDIDETNNSVLLMTVHSAKGLEFNNVFLIGMEEGIFPGNQSIYNGSQEIEEERRLAYVAITRAKKKLYITNAYTRLLYGMTNRNMPSRFLEEIPAELCKSIGYIGENNDFDNFFAKKKTVNTFNFGTSEKNARKKNEITLNYDVGQRVEHQTFGTGTVLKITKMGSDYLLDVQFDRLGLKKLMAGYAKLKVI